eukprot:TRINITY_DN3239_c0_g6_i2.p1 TRINITY_DN3239_c0_g6~~TRINITY_DN3239_c0_g6_i2.p1  ORF type:complete len:389 (+),score=87.81 TRINITY_DN3239_c0_g6_i2:49-1167(+)
MCIRDRYMGFEDDYMFTPSGSYFAPAEGNLESYREFIKRLPRIDETEVFGLHPNAEISSAINETNTLLSTALSLLPRSTSGGGITPEQMIMEKCKATLAKLPPLFDVEEAAKRHPVMYEESMNTVLQQELMRFNRLLGTIRSSLDLTIKAIEGLVVMSAELEDVFNKMFDNIIPETWMKVSYPSLKPLGSYINDLIERLHFLERWVKEGAPPTYWLSGFYFTQSFLTGTMQNYARKTKIPIDKLTFDFQVIPRDSSEFNLAKPPEIGCYVYGLFLEGARWDDDNLCLAESQPKILYTKMPHIWLIPKEQDQIDDGKHEYTCPVYKTSRRAGTLSTTGHSTNYVLSIKLPMSYDHDYRHWIKRGVAMLTQLND